MTKTIKEELLEMGYSIDHIDFALKVESENKEITKHFLQIFQAPKELIRKHRIDSLKSIITETPIELARKALGKSPVPFNSKNIEEISTEINELDFKASKIKDEISEHQLAIKKLGIELEAVKVKSDWYWKRYFSYFSSKSPKTELATTRNEIKREHDDNKESNKTKALEKT